jgi:Cof subfamily protein (haloacid dehalogenase superfamily)
MSQDVKLIALDIDGTLLAPGVAPDALPENGIVEAVAALRAKGIVVMLATGRMYPGTAPIATHLGLDEVIICQQGASIHEPGGSLRLGYTIDQNIAAELYEFAMTHEYSLSWFNHERYLVTSSTLASEYFAAVSGVKVEVHPRPMESGIKATGIDIISNEKVSSDVHRELAGRYGDRVALLDFTTVTAVHDPRASKGKALAMVASELDVEQSQVLAIGDGINDVSMLSWAGHSATPAHGDAFAKDSAKEILEGEGVSGVVSRLLAVL